MSDPLLAFLLGAALSALAMVVWIARERIAKLQAQNSYLVLSLKLDEIGECQAQAQRNHEELVEKLNRSHARIRELEDYQAIAAHPSKSPTGLN